MSISFKNTKYHTFSPSGTTTKIAKQLKQQHLAIFLFWGGVFSGQPPFAADPINLGTETSSYMDEAAIAALGNVQGMRLSWGATEEPEYFDVTEYKNSAIAAKYAYNNTSATDKDTRDLK